jgi:hypothetical protein
MLFGNEPQLIIDIELASSKGKEKGFDTVFRGIGSTILILAVLRFKNKVRKYSSNPGLTHSLHSIRFN